MKIPVQYVSDINGNPQAVQLPISEWNKVLNKLKKYEQALKLRSDLKEALDQVAAMRKTKAKKQNFNEFLNEL
jgi:hypothetical protein